MASQQTPPKTMSSRLLTMKFMQRAAASPASASSPAPSSPATPQSEGQASKRRKLQQQQQSTPNAADIGSLVDSAAVRTALEDEERKRHEAVVQRAAESGDARWVLDIPRAAAGRSSSAAASTGGGGGGGSSGRPSLNVVSVGFAQIDSQDEPSAQGPSSLDGDPDTFIHPLRRYNMDKKKVKKQPEPQSDDDNDDEDTGSGSDSDSDSAPDTGRRSYAPPSSKAEAAREALTGKRKAENAKAKELADKRRKKDIKLNKAKPKPGGGGGGGGISSISSGGGAGSGPSSSGGFSCHRCGKPGHKAAACKAAPSFKGAPAAR